MSCDGSWTYTVVVKFIVVSVVFGVIIIVVAFDLFATVVVLQVVADVFGFVVFSVVFDVSVVVDVVFVIVDFGKFRTSSGSDFR